MKILIVMICHNRLKYSKRTAMMVHGTISSPYKLVVVDNASDDGTQKWIKQQHKIKMIDGYILNEENRYPGAAANQGWEYGLKEIMPDADYLMRLDNDMWLNLGWDLKAEEYFKAMPSLGQLGIDNDAIKDPRAKLREITIKGKTLNTWPGSVGGPCIIPRAVWDGGARYDEMRWDDGRNSKLQEDSAFSRRLLDHGYMVGHMTERMAFTFANEKNWKDYPEYYKKTFTERGYNELLDKI